jgi:hypothetical protein
LAACWCGEYWTWHTVGFALFLFLVARPVSVFVGLIGTNNLDVRIRAISGWFGRARHRLHLVPELRDPARPADCGLARELIQMHAGRHHHVHPAPWHQRQAADEPAMAPAGGAGVRVAGLISQAIPQTVRASPASANVRKCRLRLPAIPAPLLAVAPLPIIKEITYGHTAVRPANDTPMTKTSPANRSRCKPARGASRYWKRTCAARPQGRHRLRQ